MRRALPPPEGLRRADLKTPSLWQRLRGLPAPENALIAIENHLVGSDDLFIERDRVHQLLAEHGADFAEALPHLQAIYARAFSHAIARNGISKFESERLRRLRASLGLVDDDARRVEEPLIRDLYQRAVRDAVHDGTIDQREREHLDAIAAGFGLTEEQRTAVYKEEATAVLQETFDEVVADGRLTSDEETRLTTLAGSLGLAITLNQQTAEAVARMRLMGRISEGQLPEVIVPITLKRGETCHATLSARHYENRTVTKTIRYAGPTARIRITKSVSYRMGSVNVQRHTEDVITLLDVGTLYLTNKRLLFDGAKKNTTIALIKIVNFQAGAGVLLIEKDSGKDQVFKSDGDIELFAACLDEARVRES